MHVVLWPPRKERERGHRRGAEFVFIATLLLGPLTEGGRGGAAKFPSSSSKDPPPGVCSE